MRRLCGLQSSLQVHSDRLMCVMNEGQGWRVSQCCLSDSWGEARPRAGRDRGGSLRQIAPCRKSQTALLCSVRDNTGAGGAIAFLAILNSAVKPSRRHESPGLYLRVSPPSGPSRCMMRIREDLILSCFPLSHFTDVALKKKKQKQRFVTILHCQMMVGHFLAIWQSSLF